MFNVTKLLIRAQDKNRRLGLADLFLLSTFYRTTIFCGMCARQYQAMSTARNHEIYPLIECSMMRWRLMVRVI